MRAIVTGATGFIGIALCEELLKQGYEVVAVIRPQSERRKRLEELDHRNIDGSQSLHVIELELNHLNILSTIPNCKADLFYHLAWNGSSGADRNDFEKQYCNITYTIEAIRAAKSCGCHKFIGAGSQAEYGVVHGMAMEEETLPNPFMMYGAAKEAAYQMGKIVAEQENITFIWPRIYSVYGIGENPGTLVNYVIDTLMKGEVPELSSCKNMWNFMNIADCVQALRVLGEQNHMSGIVHIASNDTRPLYKFVEEIRDIVSPGAKLDFGKKKSDSKRIFWLEPDCRKLNSIMKSQYISFQRGIREKVLSDSKR